MQNVVESRVEIDEVRSLLVVAMHSVVECDKSGVDLAWTDSRHPQSPTLANECHAHHLLMISSLLRMSKKNKRFIGLLSITARCLDKTGDRLACIGFQYRCDNGEWI